MGFHGNENYFNGFLLKIGEEGGKEGRREKGLWGKEEGRKEVRIYEGGREHFGPAFFYSYLIDWKTKIYKVNWIYYEYIKRTETWKLE